MGPGGEFLTITTTCFLDASLDRSEHVMSKVKLIIVLVYMILAGLAGYYLGQVILW